MFGVDKLVKRICDRMDSVSAEFKKAAEEFSPSDPVHITFHAVAASMSAVAQVIREESDK